MRETWAENLLKIKQTVKALQKGPILRHGQAWVGAGDISDQFYCEAQVELAYKLGRIKTKPMQEGIEYHERILEMEGIAPEQIIQDINLGLPCLIRIPLIARVEGLPIAGLPDGIGFWGGRPCFLVELKTFETSFRLFPSHTVQAQLYGLLLEEMGFDCSNLCLFVVGVKRGRDVGDYDALSRILFPLRLRIRDLSETLRIQEVLLDEVGKKFLKLLGLDASAVTRIRNMVRAGDFSIFSLPYRREEILEKLRWAKDYWLGRREAKPTENPAKCKVCKYAEECNYRPRLNSFLLSRQSG
ncbi:MAG: hypothetical protein QW356_08210 [Candidatus Hadarchaeales archaeon]